jgi:hypothetical protein
LHFFYSLTDDKGTDGYQDEPVGKNDSEGEFVPMKRDQEFPHQDDLGGHSAQPLNEERRLEELGVHQNLLELKFGVRSQEFGVIDFRD